MDLSMLKQKLDTLQQKQSTGQKRDYSLTFWRPTVGKQQIRIVPLILKTHLQNLSSIMVLQIKLWFHHLILVRRIQLLYLLVN